MVVSLWKKKKAEEIVLNTDELHACRIPARCTKVYWQEGFEKLWNHPSANFVFRKDRDSPSLCMKVVSMYLKQL